MSQNYEGVVTLPWSYTDDDGDSIEVDCDSTSPYVKAISRGGAIVLVRVPAAAMAIALVTAAVQSAASGTRPMNAFVHPETP